MYKKSADPKTYLENLILNNSYLIVITIGFAKFTTQNVSKYFQDRFPIRN